MAPRIGQTNHPDYEKAYERPSARLFATSTSTSMSYQYLFANAVKIEPIDKDLFTETIEPQKTDQLATELLERRGRDHVAQEGLRVVT
jgi:hypothetical protein